MRNAAREIATGVTVCDACGGSLEGLRPQARFCGAACKQEAYRRRRGVGLRLVRETVDDGEDDDLDDDTEDEDLAPGQLRVPPVPVEGGWRARGQTWRLDDADGWRLIGDDGAELRPPIRLVSRGQAEGWARVVLSVPR